MKRLFPIFALFIGLLMWLSSASAPVTAQVTNLLQNPGFEGTYSAWTENYGTAQMAPDWTPYWTEANTDQEGAGAHNVRVVQPEYKPANCGSPCNDRVYEGNNAQQWFTSFAKHEGGIYQQVFNVTPGQTYRFELWVQVWTSNLNDPAVSEQPANINFQVGIHPEGYANPGIGGGNPPGVVWSEVYPTASLADKWVKTAVEATATNNVITVYARSAPDFPVINNNIYVDAAQLFAIGGPPSGGGGGGGNQGGGSGAGQPCPTNGTWPPGCIPQQGGGGNQGGGSGCVIPPSGPWPPCATGGGGGNQGGGNQGGGQCQGRGCQVPPGANRATIKTWTNLYTGPNAVVVQGVTLSPGTRVNLFNINAEITWAEIEHNGNRGWVPFDTLHQFSVGDGGGGNQGGSGGGQPCPGNGVWPPGCIPGGGGGNQGGGSGCVIPPTGPWPPCATGGGGGGNQGGGGSGSGQPCPTNGTWPPGCIPQQGGGGSGGGSGGGTPPPPPPTGGGAGLPAFSFGAQSHSMGNMDRMKDTGMTWIKVQHKWNETDTPQAVAERVSRAHANGLKILLAMPGPANPSSINFSAYTNFLRGVAALPDPPDAIEVWNEMNIDREWPAGQISASQYVDQMLKPAYQAIKGANSNVIVISGAPAPTGFFGGCSGVGCDDNLYMQQMYNAGGANYMDCVGVHMNESIVSPTQGSGDPRGGHYSYYYPAMVDTYSNAMRNSRPLCFTELGYLSGDDIGGIGAFTWGADTSVAEHAQWLSEAVDISKNRESRVRMVIVFNFDIQTSGVDPQNGFAMIRPGGGCPSCDLIKPIMGR